MEKSEEESGNNVSSNVGEEEEEEEIIPLGKKKKKKEEEECVPTIIKREEEEEEQFPDQISERAQQLSPEQQKIVDLVAQGKNVFITGPGGTGKSFLLQYIVHILTRRYPSECIAPSVSNQKDRCECYVCNVAITASTGIAALEIGGTTLHSAAGIGIPYEVKDFNKMWNLKNKWRNLSVLVIDEISMISGELFEYLEQTICKIRANEKPFGGLQVIVAGDFFQLLPIQNKSSNVMNTTTEFLNRGLAFESPAWHKANFESVILKTVFRQDDAAFVAMLNDIRTGKNQAVLQEIVKQCSRPLESLNGVFPTNLYAKNQDVNVMNETELYKLPDDEVLIHSVDEIETRMDKQPLAGNYGVFDEQLHQIQYEKLANHLFWSTSLAAKLIKLKIGAQRSNVNQIPIVKFRNGREFDCMPCEFSCLVLKVGECKRFQVPLKLAWALTIHKCQGCELDYFNV
ncbi:hypothetical protein CY35_01G135300 [Sphagnum magellanicum]|nr:hypothetical protein CY35_01G135300 [Sphagnum magellanicum]